MRRESLRLTLDQWVALDAALRCAAEEYEKHAASAAKEIADLAGANTGDGMTLALRRAQQQFERQKTDALELSKLICAEVGL